jgi:hypothetical protein
MKDNGVERHLAIPNEDEEAPHMRRDKLLRATAGLHEWRLKQHEKRGDEETQ